MELQRVLEKHGFKSGYIPTEDTEQKALADWLRLNKILFHHSPNGGVRHIATAGRLKSHGTSKGFPDIIVLDPPPIAPADFVGTAIELKRLKGGTVSPEQKAWLADLEKRRWKCYVAKGAGAAIDFLQSLGYGRGR